jgi:hypothetical protein
MALDTRTRERADVGPEEETEGGRDEHLARLLIGGGMAASAARA